MKPALGLSVLAFLCALPLSPAGAETPAPVAVERALALAAENSIAQPRSFWRSDDGKWAGVSGYGANGTWYEIVIDAQGNLVRAGHDDGAKAPVSLAQAAKTAASNGLSRLDTLRYGGGAWFALGVDPSGARLWLLIDANSGAVVKKGS